MAFRLPLSVAPLLPPVTLLTKGEVLPPVTAVKLDAVNGTMLPRKVLAWIALPFVVKLVTAFPVVVDMLVTQVAAFAAPAASMACRAMTLAPVKRGRVLEEATSPAEIEPAVNCFRLVAINGLRPSPIRILDHNVANKWRSKWRVLAHDI